MVKINKILSSKICNESIKKLSRQIRHWAKNKVLNREKVAKNQFLSSKICNKNIENHHCKSDFGQKHM